VSAIPVALLRVTGGSLAALVAHVAVAARPGLVLGRGRRRGRGIRRGRGRGRRRGRGLAARLRFRWRGRDDGGFRAGDRRGGWWRRRGGRRRRSTVRSCGVPGLAHRPLGVDLAHSRTLAGPTDRSAARPVRCVVSDRSRRRTAFSTGSCTPRRSADPARGAVLELDVHVRETGELADPDGEGVVAADRPRPGQQVDGGRETHGVAEVFAVRQARRPGAPSSSSAARARPRRPRTEVDRRAGGGCLRLHVGRRGPRDARARPRNWCRPPNW
jgi:hypothetical protein